MSPSYKKHANSYHTQPHIIDAHRASLQTRLLATLDTLDDLQRSHELELEELHQQSRTLRARCRIFKDRAKSAEAERDEMREGVNKLVEKVEIANDHRVLPLSRIHVQYPLEPITVIPSQPIIDGDRIQKDAYLSSIFSALQNELFTEKRALAQLKRTSEARIALLEAQVARRDAELQEYQPFVCYSRTPPEPVAMNSHKASLQHPEIPLSQKEARRVLEETAARQRTLEMELDGLNQKLQLERRLSSPCPKNFHVAYSPVVVATGPSSTIPDSAPVLLESTHNPVLSDIDRQLVRLRAEIRELQVERDNVAVAVNAKSENGAHEGEEQFRDILLIEDECIRLRHSERSLRQQLLLAKASASAMEQEFKSLVSGLQRELHRLRNPGVSSESRGEAYIENGCFPNFGSPGMDASSLDPSASLHVISGPSSPAPPPRTSPAANLILSDDDRNAVHTPLSTPPPPATSTAVGDAPMGHAAVRFRLVQSELDQARRDVAERDGAISSLRAQLAALEASLRARLGRGTEELDIGLAPGHS